MRVRSSLCSRQVTDEAAEGVCCHTQHVCVQRESVHTAWVCLHCVWVLPGEPLAREELAQAWVWGLFRRKPDLIVTPGQEERAVGVAAGTFLQQQRGSL